MKWIRKETKPSNVSHTNPQGSKHVLMPKIYHFHKNVHKDKKQTIFKTRKRKSFASHPSYWYHFKHKGFVRSNPHWFKKIWVPKEEFYANNGEPKVVWAPKPCG